MGLSYPTMAAFDKPPVFDSIINQGLLQENIFAFYLGEASEFHLGGIDTSFIKEGEDIHYVDVID